MLPLNTGVTFAILLSGVQCCLNLEVIRCYARVEDAMLKISEGESPVYPLLQDDSSWGKFCSVLHLICMKMVAKNPCVSDQMFKNLVKQNMPLKIFEMCLKRTTLSVTKEQFAIPALSIFFYQEKSNDYSDKKYDNQAKTEVNYGDGADDGDNDDNIQSEKGDIGFIIVNGAETNDDKDMNINIVNGAEINNNGDINFNIVNGAETNDNGDINFNTVNGKEKEKDGHASFNTVSEKEKTDNGDIAFDSVNGEISDSVGNSFSDIADTVWDKYNTEDVTNYEDQYRDYDNFDDNDKFEEEDAEAENNTVELPLETLQDDWRDELLNGDVIDMTDFYDMSSDYIHDDSDDFDYFHDDVNYNEDEYHYEIGNGAAVVVVNSTYELHNDSNRTFPDTDGNSDSGSLILSADKESPSVNGARKLRIYFYLFFCPAGLVIITSVILFY